MEVRVADFIAEFLVKNNINKCFTVTGGGAMHLNDAFGHCEGMKCIYNHHEQACTMAAEGYARYTGKIAAVCVTSGPGGTNALTGVMGAWLDSIPMIIISGQMKYCTTISSTSVPLRQLGFQEFNIIDSVKCMTKYAKMIIKPEEIQYELEKALFIAKNGRPGPVWIDIPVDIQGAKIDISKLKKYELNCISKIEVNDIVINDMLSIIKEAKKPVILVGNGVRIAKANKLLEEVIDRLQIPVVTAWNAHDNIWDDHPLYCGRPGTIGNRGGNIVVQNSDLLISFGCRMNIRQIGYEWDKFAPNAYKIAIDIDKGELEKPTLKIDMPINADIKDVLKKIIKSGYRNSSDYCIEWRKWCKKINSKYPTVLPSYYEKKTPINPYIFMNKLSQHLDENDVTVASNGTACVCAFQAMVIKKGERLFTNSGCSSMGYGLPASIGIAISRKERVICLEGDGSIQMNIQELQTVVHNKLNIKIFWLNNEGYHSIRQTQHNNFKADEKGYCGVDRASGISFPSAQKIANAYGIDFVYVDNIDEIDEKLSEVLNNENPIICEVRLDKLQGFEPKVASQVLPDGKIISSSLENMYPFLSDEEMEENKFEN